jgi:hypothetical protein
VAIAMQVALTLSLSVFVLCVSRHLFFLASRDQNWKFAKKTPAISSIFFFCVSLLLKALNLTEQLYKTPLFFFLRVSVLWWLEGSHDMQGKWVDIVALPSVFYFTWQAVTALSCSFQRKVFFFSPWKEKPVYSLLCFAQS